MSVATMPRLLLSFVAVLALLPLRPAVGAAQQTVERLIPVTVTPIPYELTSAGAGVDVGIFGGGLETIEQRRPDLAPLAARFRMQRRSGVVLGLVAVGGAAVAFGRFADMGRSDLQWGEPESNVLVGALGAMTLSVLQLQAADRTLRVLADRYAAGSGAPTP